MSSIDATVSMLEVMPEEARLKVLEFTKSLFTSKRPANPFVPLTTEQILRDLEISRQQAAQGQTYDMGEALEELRRRHGFV